MSQGVSNGSISRHFLFFYVELYLWFRYITYTCLIKWEYTLYIHVYIRFIQVLIYIQYTRTFRMCRFLTTHVKIYVYIQTYTHAHAYVRTHMRTCTYPSVRANPHIPLGSLTLCLAIEPKKVSIQTISFLDSVDILMFLNLQTYFDFLNFWYTFFFFFFSSSRNQVIEPCCYIWEYIPVLVCVYVSGRLFICACVSVYIFEMFDIYQTACGRVWKHLKLHLKKKKTLFFFILFMIIFYLSFLALMFWNEAISAALHTFFVEC